MLQYPRAIYPRRVDIYETYNPGATTCISALLPSGQWQVLWSGPPQRTGVDEACIFSPPLLPAPQPVSVIRIDMDTTGWPSWYEVDAVALIGDEPALVGRSLVPPVDTSLTIRL